MKSGGDTGFNALYAGSYAIPSFYNLASDSSLWTSTKYAGNVWYRGLSSGAASRGRNTAMSSLGFSIRCLAN